MNKKKILGVIALISVLLPMSAMAAITTPVVPFGEGTGITWAEIQGWIEWAASTLMVIGVLIAIIMIVWGGIMWMVSRGDEEKVKGAKSMVWNGILGAAVVLAVGVILQTIALVVSRTGFFGA